MFYILKDDILLSYSDKKYDENCLETDIITKEELDKDPKKVIVQDGELVLNPDWSDIELQQAKDNKIVENDLARDAALNQGVEYKDILFDSDTDQKVNLLAIVSTMDDEQTIIWFGKDNQPLECNKQDLINIGGLITQLHSFCWNKNALIKAEINNAETVEEVEAVEIDYTLPTQEDENEPEIVEEGSENEGN